MNTEILTSAFRRVRLRLLSGSRHGGDDPEDALQEAFCRLWTRRVDITDRSQAEGLLSTAARNVGIDSIRRRNQHPMESIDDSALQHLSGADCDDDADGREELLREVERLVAECLSPRDREILYRRDRDGWEFDELAEHYSLSEGNIRMIVSRARKRIREVYRNGKSRKGGNEL